MQESNSGLDLEDGGKEGWCQRGEQEDRDKAQKAGFSQFHFQFNHFWLTVHIENRVIFMNSPSIS